MMIKNIFPALLVFVFMISPGLYPAGNGEITPPNSPPDLKDTTYKYWMAAGFAVKKDYSALNLGYYFSVADFYGKMVYSLKRGFWGKYGSDGFTTNSIDLAPGIRAQLEYFHLSIFSGISLLWGERLGDYDNSPSQFRGVGLIFEANSFFRPAKELGIGIGLYGNLNSIKTYGGVMLLLSIGDGK